MSEIIDKVKANQVHGRIYTRMDYIDRMMFQVLDVSGLVQAIYGMRLSHQSQDKMDTLYWDHIGPNDMKLIKKLINQHASHRKFLREIQVWAHVRMSLDWWFEFDTYLFAIKSKDEYTRLSDSTMHNLKKSLRSKEYNKIFNPYVTQKAIDNMVELLEKKASITELKANLPCGFILDSIINFNYETALNIYFQRHLHKLEWWKLATDAILELPHMETFIEIIEGGGKNEQEETKET